MNSTGITYIMRVHHLGIVVKDINQAINEYKVINQDFEIILDEYVESDLVRIVLVKNEGITLEFIEPISVESPVSNFLDKGGGLHHICYETEDIDNYIKTHKRNIKIVKGKQIGFCGFNTVFFVQRNINNRIGLIELVQMNGEHYGRKSNYYVM